MAPATTDRILDLRSLLQDLVRDGRLSQEDANLVLGATRTRQQTAMHPLAYIATQNLDDQARPGKTLTAEVLTDWLAQKANLSVVHIDPLKIDVPRVTSVVSY